MTEDNGKAKQIEGQRVATGNLPCSAEKKREQSETTEAAPPSATLAVDAARRLRIACQEHKRNRARYAQHTHIRMPHKQNHFAAYLAKTHAKIFPEYAHPET